MHVTRRVEISRADPSDVPDHVLTSLHRQVVDSAAQDQPYEPPPTLRSWRSYLRLGWSGEQTVLLVAGGGEGHAVVELPNRDNLHAGLVEVHVAADRRRRGVGRALVGAAADLLGDLGRSLVLFEARDGSALEALLTSVGASRELTDVRRHQRLRELDPQQVSALRGRASDYRLEAWTGATPEPLRAAVADAMLSLNDAPLGGLRYDDEVWDAARVSQRDHAAEQAGLRLHSVLALAPDGAAAGLTDVAVSEAGSYAWQWNTGVAPAHRGHRLGMLLKTTMVERLLEREPDVLVVSTWNAEDNPHMIGINEALGYVPVDQMSEWQLELPT